MRRNGELRRMIIYFMTNPLTVTDWPLTNDNKIREIASLGFAMTGGQNVIARDEVTWGSPILDAN
jgi:hypothetical protein